jgi:hypothetical protein
MPVVEDRVRYRLSVSRELDERMRKLADLFGLHPQQMVYMSMGTGLRTLEQIAYGVQPAALASMVSALREENREEADKRDAEILKEEEEDIRGYNEAVKQGKEA